MTGPPSHAASPVGRPPNRSGVAAHHAPAWLRRRNAGQRGGPLRALASRAGPPDEGAGRSRVPRLWLVSAGRLATGGALDGSERHRLPDAGSVDLGGWSRDVPAPPRRRGRARPSAGRRPGRRHVRAGLTGDRAVHFSARADLVATRGG